MNIWMSIGNNHQALRGSKISLNKQIVLGKTFNDRQLDLFNLAGIDLLRWNKKEGVVNVDNNVVIMRPNVIFLNVDRIKDLDQRASQLEVQHIVYKLDDRPIMVSMAERNWQKISDELDETDDFDKVIDLIATTFNEHRMDDLSDENVVVVETMLDLQRVGHTLKEETLDRLMLDGVMVVDRASTWIDPEVVVGADTIIYPGTLLQGHTVIGEGCNIGPGARIRNSKIGNDVVIKDSTLMDASVDDRTTVGPYAYLRPGANLGKDCKVGDFVEVKNATFEDGAKASHLAYIGDAHVGKNVNLGCGVVFVNYDGKHKNKTIVEDDAFVGCNVNLISPVTVKKGAYVAAGSTITEDVEENSLAIARCRQTQKKDWVKK